MHTEQHLKLCRTVHSPGHAYHQLGRSQLSTAVLNPLNIYQRAVNYLNDYPFVKYSIVLCAVVLGGSLAVEKYSQHRKKQQPQILSLPAQVGHTTLPRAKELARLQEAVKKARRKDKGVVYVTGPSGSGKTVLTSQYGKHFVEQTHNFTYRFRISKPTVLYLNGSSHEQMCVSLQEAALCLGVKGNGLQSQPTPRSPVDASGQATDEQLLELARAVQEKLVSNKVPWLVVVDDLSPPATPIFDMLFSTGVVEWNWDMGHVVVSTQQPVDRAESAVCCMKGYAKIHTQISLD